MCLADQVLKLSFHSKATMQGCSTMHGGFQSFEILFGTFSKSRKTLDVNEPSSPH